MLGDCYQQNTRLIQQFIISDSGTRSLRLASEAGGATSLLDGTWKKVHDHLVQWVKVTEYQR